MRKLQLNVFFPVFLILVLFCLFIITCSDDGCGPKEDDDDDDSEDCPGGLRLNHERTWTEAPSLVAVSFSVETCDGKPGAGLSINDFEIKEDNEPISIYESHQDLIGLPRGFQLSTLLLLDLSSSVQGDKDNLKAGAEAFVNAMEDNHEVALYYFRGDENIFKIHDFTSNKGDLITAINSLENYMMDASTNLYGAFLEGLSVLDNKKEEADSNDKAFYGSLLVFTDGTDRAKLVDKKESLSRVKSSSHSVYTLGVGNEIDQDELEEFGKTGFFWVEDSELLTEAFEDLAEAIQNETKKYYLLAYCSPIRTGKPQMVLRANWQGKWGELKTSYEAYDFEDGCGEDDVNNFGAGGSSDDDDDDNDNNDDSSGDTWTDTTTNLVWQDASTCCYDWNQSKSYCQNLNWGGYSDWRLPTISELRSLIRGCSETETNGSCGVTDSCLNSSCWSDASCNGCSPSGGPGTDGMYWPSEIEGECCWYYSSSTVTNDTGSAWYVSFGTGYLAFGDNTQSGNVRCVR